MAEGEPGGDGNGQAAVVPEFAEENGAETEERTDGQIDAGGDDDGGEREGEEADFAGVAQDVELPVHGAEADDDTAAVGPGAGEQRRQPLGDEHVAGAASRGERRRLSNRGWMTRAWIARMLRTCLFRLPQAVGDDRRGG